MTAGSAVRCCSKQAALYSLHGACTHVAWLQAIPVADCLIAVLATGFKA